MILIYQIKQKSNFWYIVLLLLLCTYTFAPSFVYAQQGLSLSVTPTLFQMTADPGQDWDSSIKVINNNAQKLTVYATAVDFSPKGENGEVSFTPIPEGATDNTTLAQWIDITSKPIVIQPEQSQSVPFTVHVPDNAPPGGHFAAIMIGTRPPAETGEKVQVETSQIVTSLFFMTLSGDVTEKGDIREFTANHTFVTIPKINFQVRFENKGNVYLQPQGEIRITNMWGKERGVIPINHGTHFGNVLPNSIRKFNFAWKGEQSLTDIGRYKAVVSLGYGSQARQFDSRIMYFWVVPIKAVLIVLGSALLILLFFNWAIKAYIRRMLTLAGIDSQARGLHKQAFKRNGDVLIERMFEVRAPVQNGVLDLTQRLKQARALMDKMTALGSFIFEYRVFFGSVIALCIIVITVWLFFVSVTKEQRNYQVTIANTGKDVTLSSEDILYERAQQKKNTVTTLKASSTQPFSLVIVNSSNTPGAAADLETKLANTYHVDDLQSDFGPTKDKTVIVYNPTYQTQALALSKQLDNALLSANPDEASSTQPDVIIYIGNDYSME